MSKRNYTHVQALLPEIKAMVESGKTQREIGEHYGFVRRLGRPEKDAALAAEIQQEKCSLWQRISFLF